MKNRWKDTGHLKSNKNSLHSNRFKNDMEKKGGRGEKRKVEEKFNNATTTIKLLTFMFCIWKRICFAWKHSLEKCSLYYDISSKVFFSVAGYLKRSNEKPTYIQMHISRKFFCLPRNLICLLQNCFSRYIFLKDIYTKFLKELKKFSLYRS